MQDNTPSPSTSASSIPKAVWVAAGTFGTIIVVLLAAVLYKLSVPASPPGQSTGASVGASAPMASGSTMVGGNAPQSAVAVTSANPEAPSASQFAPLQPPAPAMQPKTVHNAKPRRETAERREPEASHVAGTAPAQSGAPEVFSPQPVQAPAPQPVCASCGTVLSVTPVQEQGQANGLGAVVGGLVGGLLGNQVGGGNGRTAATVVGAVGGGFAGNEVQKRMNAHTVYRVEVRMDDGQVRTTTLGAAPPVGQRVQFGANGGLNPIQ